jgi:hypothetical protein
MLSVSYWWISTIKGSRIMDVALFNVVTLKQFLALGAINSDLNSLLET